MSKKKKQKTNAQKLNSIINQNNISTEQDVELSPQAYFDRIKSLKRSTTDIELDAIYDNCLELVNKYNTTGQIRALRKVLFCMECITKEKELLDMGITTYVYKDDLDFYIDEITKKYKSKPIKIIELERYEREIPDEIVDIIAKTKDIFNQMYIVYTDYTKKEERVIEENKRKKDPILFGTFQSRKNKVCIDRFYYLGDWIDEYCDLTLDKMIEQTEKLGRNIERTIQTPKDIEELKSYIAAHYEIDESTVGTFVKKADKDIIKSKTKGSFFKNIKTFFTRRNK